MTALDPTTRLFKSHQIRAFVSGKETLIVATDICAALGLKNASSTLSKLSPDDKRHVTLPSVSGPRSALAVTEAGLMHLIFSSRKPVAREFWAWALNELLPKKPTTPKTQPQPELRLNAPSAIFDKENRATLKALEKRCKAAVSAKARRGLYGPWKERPQGLTEGEVEAFMTTVDLYIENVFQLIRMEDLVAGT